MMIKNFKSPTGLDKVFIVIRLQVSYVPCMTLLLSGWGHVFHHSNYCQRKIFYHGHVPFIYLTGNNSSCLTTMPCQKRKFNGSKKLHLLDNEPWRGWIIAQSIISPYPLIFISTLHEAILERKKTYLNS